MSIPQKKLVQCRDPHEKKAILGQDPSNTIFGGVTPPTANGNTADAFNKEMIKSIRNRGIQDTARIFLDKACPGDWSSSWGVGYGGVLRKCANGEPTNKLPDPEPEGWNQELEIMASTQFRLQLGLLTDHIVKSHGLPVPSGKGCLSWNEWEWMQEMEKKIPNWRYRDEKIAMKLKEGRFIFQPGPGQRPTWIRPWHYLSAAIVEANLSEQKTMNLIDDISVFIRQ
ncbi:hypothetical protein F4680DRAFT_465705 [Xylaria scruposa]|nr:hypothetical protein F4680DRAFT_465705 [Xylaria scruposa]